MNTSNTSSERPTFGNESNTKDPPYRSPAEIDACDLSLLYEKLVLVDKAVLSERTRRRWPKH